MLVIFAYAKRNQELARKNLEWIRDGLDAKKHELLLLYPDSLDASAEIAAAETAFGKVQHFSFTDPYENWEGNPWPWAANFCWKLAVDTVDFLKAGPYFLWLEPDSVLTRRDSLNALEDAYLAQPKQFMGYWCGKKEGAHPPHMNGVGIWREVYQYAPAAMSVYSPQDEVEAKRYNPASFDQIGGSEVAANFADTNLIQFEWRKEDQIFLHDPSEWLKPETRLFHTEKTGKLLHWLRNDGSRLGVTDEDNSNYPSEGMPSVMQLMETVGQSFPHKAGEVVRGSHSALQPDISHVDIFIKTYPHDADYHYHCGRSIHKFFKGYRNIVVQDDTDDRKPGYLWQQVCKLNADTRTDAAYILVTDSDTLFTCPVTALDFCIEGRPFWIITPFAALDESVDKWQQCMLDFFGVKPRFEFMRRQPFFFPRWLLQAFRTFCWGKHGKSVEDYVMAQENFSEWNVLGFYAYLYHRDCFTWLNTDVDAIPAPVVRQFWSHHPIEKNIVEIEAILSSNVVDQAITIPPGMMWDAVLGVAAPIPVLERPRKNFSPGLLENLKKARAVRTKKTTKRRKKKKARKVSKV